MPHGKKGFEPNRLFSEVMRVERHRNSYERRDHEAKSIRRLVAHTTLPRFSLTAVIPALCLDTSIATRETQRHQREDVQMMQPSQNFASSDVSGVAQDFLVSGVWRAD